MYNYYNHANVLIYLIILIISYIYDCLPKDEDSPYYPHDF